MKPNFALLKKKMAERERLSVELNGFARAAVLVPIVDAVDCVEPELLFIVRKSDLARHPGQIAFPGGRAEPSDRDLAHTALRETHEELGISPDRIEVLGLLDDVPTPTQFVITPVVGVVRELGTLTPDTVEIADLFRCGVGAISEPARYTNEGERSFLGVTYAMHQYKWEQHTIWGATARILHQLLSLVA
jgi:8-oxo-dGTP pyrophosphatase MutT (NUDIX family)